MLRDQALRSLPYQLVKPVILLSPSCATSTENTQEIATSGMKGLQDFRVSSDEKDFSQESISQRYGVSNIDGQ